MLASEYGWSKYEIENHVYFDELYELSVQINKRRIEGYRMQLAIVQNPHIKKPKELWDILNAYDRNREEKLDKAGFELFKEKLQQSTNVVVK